LRVAALLQAPLTGKGVPLKELLLVLVIAATVFWFARPIAALFSTESDFRCRRNAWYAVTIVAFICPSFPVFCFFAALIIIWAARRDSNPSALYLMLLYVVPEFSWRVPMVGIASLVDLDFPMLLSLCLMVPAALRLMKGQPRSARRLQLLDYCLLAYLALTSVYFLLPEVARGVLMTWTATNCVRRAFESLITVYVPYFVISRAHNTRKELQDTLGALCLAGGVMAAIGTFEGARHWLLYGLLRDQWDPGYNAYMERGGSLRAMASTSHPLVFGYVLVVAFGVWLGLMSAVKTALWRVGVIVLDWLGLLAAYSRGPWLAGILIYFLYVAVRDRKLSRLLKVGVTAGVIAAVLAVSPLGDRIARVVPFLGGNVDADSISYRQRLLDRAWDVIQDSPWLGDQYGLVKLQDLRAAGIIDLMNGFVNILLDNGFIGLSLFLSFVVLGLYKGWKLSGEAQHVGVELAAIGAALVATLLGVMEMMWAGGLLLAPTTLLIALIFSTASVGARAHPSS
jgi:O-Antigen ligase